LKNWDIYIDMKKRTLKEEIERIRTITYGKNVLFENDILNKLVQGSDDNNVKPYDDPQKADFVEDNVRKFLNDLKSIDHEVSEQKLGTMEYQKEVELVQIGLVLLGYELPVHGIDGFFGPETATAVRKYKTENNILNESLIPGIDEMVWNKMPWGINDGEKVDGINWKNHDTHIHFGFTNVDVAVKVIEKALSLGLHAGENPYTSKVYPVHVSDSHHYETFSQTVNGKKVGGGLDVSGEKSKMEELFNWVSTELGGGGSVTMSDVSQTDTETKTETVSTEMIQSMSSKLESRGVTKDELDKLVDKVSTGGGDIFTDLDLTIEEDYKMYAKICELYLKTRQPNPLGITGTMLADGAKSAFIRHSKYVPPELALSQLAAEGGVGDPNVNNKPVRTKNPYNIANMDDGSIRTYPTIQSAIDAYFDLIARSYLGKGKTSNDLIYNFVNHENQRYAKEEDYEDVVTSIAKQVKKIANTI
jgi:peptidoglycan hydrolase-like protein with peptidoglycan-binding domain